MKIEYNDGNSCVKCELKISSSGVKVTQFFSKQAKLERYIERKSCETMDCIKDELIILPHLHYTYILVLPYVISSVSILFYSTV